MHPFALIWQINLSVFPVSAVQSKGKSLYLAARYSHPAQMNSKNLVSIHAMRRSAKADLTD